MANTTDYLPFGTDPAANVDTQANYAGTSYRTKGFQTGLAKSTQLNKVWRQSSMIAAAWTGVINNILLQNVADDGNLANLTTQLTQTIQAICTALEKPQVITVPFSATPVFDCSKGNILVPAFVITLTGNVTSSTIINQQAGQLIRVCVTQDSSGGHTFVWPSNYICYGAGAIDTTPNQVANQLFIVAASLALDALGPLTLRV